MTGPLWLKWAVVAPGLVFSLLLAVVFGALLPPVGELAAFLAWAAIGLVLATGGYERRAVALLWQARAPQPGEQLALARVTPRVEAAAGRSVPVLITSHGDPVGSAGRRHLLLRADVVHAHRLGRISDPDLAALMLHALGRLTYGRPRFDTAIACWSLPWHLLRTMGLGVARGAARLPLVGLAWQARFIVGGIAVVQEIQQGRPANSVIVGLVLAFSYLMPHWRRRWDSQLTRAADQYVAAHGHRDGLVRVLTQAPLSPALLDRLDRLKARSTSPAPPGRTDPAGRGRWAAAPTAASTSATRCGGAHMVRRAWPASPPGGTRRAPRTGACRPSPRRAGVQHGPRRRPGPRPPA